LEGACRALAIELDSVHHKKVWQRLPLLLFFLS